MTRRKPSRNYLLGQYNIRIDNAIDSVLNLSRKNRERFLIHAGLADELLKKIEKIKPLDKDMSYEDMQEFMVYDFILSKVIKKQKEMEKKRHEQ